MRGNERLWKVEGKEGKVFVDGGWKQVRRYFSRGEDLLEGPSTGRKGRTSTSATFSLPPFSLPPSPSLFLHPS